jgi:hypothetical protein
MIAFYIILAASPILLLGALAFIALIVWGIRRGERGLVTASSCNLADKITCRVIGAGFRATDERAEGEVTRDA